MASRGGQRRTRRTGPRPVDRASPMPLWAQVHEDLRRRLDAGEFSESFPGELALVADYGVSRATVREALRRLRSEGIVVAERGRAPRLAEPGVINQPLGALYSLFASVEQAGQVQRSIVRALDLRTDPDVARRLDLDDDAALLYLERLRLADEEPLALDRVWLPAERTSGLLDADFAHTALYDELDRRCGIRLSGGEERIRAVVPARSERTLLRMPAGVAVFAVTRLGYAAGAPFEWRDTTIRGDRFSVTASFSAREGYRLGLAAG